MARRTGSASPEQGERSERADTLTFADGSFLPVWKKSKEQKWQSRKNTGEIFGEMEGLLEALESREISWRIPLKNTKKAWRFLKAAGEKKIDTVEKAMLVLNDQGRKQMNFEDELKQKYRKQKKRSMSFCRKGFQDDP